MDFEKLFRQLVEDVTDVIKEKLGEFADEGKADIQIFLEASKENVKRWAGLVATGELTLNDLEWLLKSQKDLLLLTALYQAGVSKITLGRLKNTIIKTIVRTVADFLI